MEISQLANSILTASQVSKQFAHRINGGLSNTISGVGSGHLSLSNIGPSNTISIGSNDFWLAEQSNVKKYQIFDSTEDLIVLATTWHRIRKENAVNTSPQTLYITSIIDNALFSAITQEDRNLALVIRDYYSKKIMVQTLREQPLSPYRTDLLELINSDGKKFKEEMQPLAYKLPEFYEYDLVMDELFSKVDSHIADDESKIIPWQTTKTLRPLKATQLNKKTSKQTEYWLVDENNKVNRIKIDTSNTLKHMWDRAFEKEPSMKISGTYRLGKRDNVQFYNVQKWTIDS